MIEIKKVDATLSLTEKRYIYATDPVFGAKSTIMPPHFMEVDPIDINVRIKGLDMSLFMHREILGQYIISEAFTGLRVSSGKTIQEAIEKAHEKVTPDFDLEACLKRAFNEQGLSPAVKVTVNDIEVDIDRGKKVSA